VLDYAKGCEGDADIGYRDRSLPQSLREHSEYDEAARRKDDREHRPAATPRWAKTRIKPNGIIWSNIDLVQPSMDELPSGA